MSEHGNVFDHQRLRGDLKLRSVQGGALTLGVEFSRFVVRVASGMALARLLTPEDFGVVAMVVAVANFAALFRDLGLAVATIQRERVTHEQLSNLFWVNVLVGVTTMAITIALAPAIARFYGEARLVRVTVCLSSAFLFGGLAVQHRALLKRQMRFGRLAAVDVSGTVFSVLLGVGLAWLWRGTPQAYMALVWMRVAWAACAMFGVWLSCRWIPRLPTAGSGVGSMLSFGMDMTAYRILNFLTRNLDRILIGKYCGAGQVGYYNKAYQFLLLPISQLRSPLVSVATPALSALQNDDEMFRRYMRRLLSVLSFLTMPLMALTCVCAREIVLLFFGGQWIEAVPIMRVQSVLGFIQPVAGICGLVLVTLGKTRRCLVFGALNAVPIVLAFVIGLRWGALGVAIAYAVVSYVTLIPLLWFCFHGTPVGVRLFLASIARPGLTSVAAGCAVWALRRCALFPASTVGALVCALLSGGVLYLALHCIDRRGRASLAGYVSYVRMLAGAGGKR